ncbi:MAG: hypothetical protein JW852_08480 [Spirochaetales bacterium]|nr:hypothetical protein [Spirochaetales bacterium]
MLETMQYDVHLARERDLLRTAEMHKAFRMLKARRKKERSIAPVLGNLWLVAEGWFKNLRRVADSIISPGRHGVGAGR